MKRRSLFLFGVIALLLVQAAPLPAQIIGPQGWLGDDGFNVGCCKQVHEITLPQFPPFNLDGVYCCIEKCRLEKEFQVRVSTRHIPITCDLALIPFRAFPASPGAPGWAGTLIAKYSRTWVELSPDGRETQVWRFLVNTDAFSFAGDAPCPIPPHPAGIETHFTGHIDYACVLDATGNLEFKMALNLNHLPGCISHNLISASPLLGPPFVDGHHERSYHLMAPASFECAPVPLPLGQTPSEAVRSTWLPPLPYTCLGEAVVRDGFLGDPTVRNCLCPDIRPEGPFVWTHEFLIGDVICDPASPPSTYFPIPLPSPLPPLVTGFVGFSVGTWVGMDAFPGNRELSIYWGLLNYFDECNPNAPPFHIVTGVSTTGPPGFVFGGTDLAQSQPWRVFLDLEDMILANGLFGPHTLGFGTYFLSQVVWNLNLF